MSSKLQLISTNSSIERSERYFQGKIIKIWIKHEINFSWKLFNSSNDYFSHSDFLPNFLKFVQSFLKTLWNVLNKNKTSQNISNVTIFTKWSKEKILCGPWFASGSLQPMEKKHKSLESLKFIQSCSENKLASKFVQFSTTIINKIREEIRKT